MDRYVAIKVLPSELAESKEFATRFQQEARIIAKLEHPHILPVFDYGESDGIDTLECAISKQARSKKKWKQAVRSL